MISFIISTDYTHTTIALFKEKQRIASIQEENKNTSKFLLYHMQALCEQYAVAFADISFIGINQGPGPFTTLRVTLATINGIAFASGIPLVGVDGIQALVDEHYSSEYPYTVALLNAFNDEAYYALQSPHRELRIGYNKIDQVFQQIHTEYGAVQVRLIGSGVVTFKDQLAKLSANENIYIPKNVPLAPSIEYLAQVALAQFNNEHTSHKLLPLYLKAMNYKTSITVL